MHRHFYFPFWSPFAFVCFEYNNSFLSRAQSAEEVDGYRQAIACWAPGGAVSVPVRLPLELTVQVLASAAVTGAAVRARRAAGCEESAWTRIGGYGDTLHCPAKQRHYSLRETRRAEFRVSFAGQPLSQFVRCRHPRRLLYWCSPCVRRNRAQHW